MEKYSLLYTDSFLLLVLLTAVIYDLRYQKIPNWLTLSTFILGVVYHIYLQGVSGLLFSIEGASAGIALLIVPYLMGGMGAGDAKLMGAVGAMLGPKGIFVAFLLTALIGGVYAVGVLTFYGSVSQMLGRYGLLLKTFFLTRKIIYIPPSEQEKKPRLRYGVAIALGTIMAMAMKKTVYVLLNFP
jgi:prepilin peptidase CpaA